MSLYKRQQANPDTEQDVESAQAQAAVARVAKALDLNSAAIHRWSLKALLALNLVVWSLALPIAFLLYVSRLQG